MPTTTVSPTAFAVRQLLLAWTPWIILAAIVVGLGVGAATLTGGSTIAHVLGVVVLLVATGGIALMYAAAWMHMLYRGMIPTPRSPWRVELTGSAVRIASGTRATAIPLAELASVTLLEDDSWDQMNGIETRCLVLRRRRGARVSIPGTSHGFNELLASLRRLRDVSVESL